MWSQPAARTAHSSVTAVLSQGASEAIGKESRKAPEEKQEPPQTHQIEPSRSKRVICVVPLNSIQRSNRSQWLAPRSPGSHGQPCQSPCFLALPKPQDLCISAAWLLQQRGRTPSTRRLPLKRAERNQLNFGQQRQGKLNACVTYRGCLTKCLEHRSSGIKSPGK